LLEKNPNVGIVFGMMEEFEDKDNTITPRPGREHLPGCCPGTMLVKKEVFKDIGSFSTKWELAGFLDWLQRSKKKGIINQMLNANILRRRIHSSNSGAGKHELLMKEYAEVILENK
nr:hypothetical protein [Pseudomonadota bacterium]